MMKAYRTGSGYYVDVGASQLIIDGEIKVKPGVEIETADADRHPLRRRHRDRGRRDHPVDRLPVDARGGGADRLARGRPTRIGTCWGLGSGTRDDPGPWHGELRNMYKPMAQEKLWFQGGNLALQRFFSKFVALQIKARMEGIATPVYSHAALADMRSHSSPLDQQHAGR